MGQASPSKTFSEASETILRREARPSSSSSSSSSSDTAVFAGGCFWGIELAFQRVPGVLQTEVGYCQGFKENPSYEEVCMGTTGHAEAVKVVFDPAVVPYEDLLVVFWDLIDPLALNRQGNDCGTQYRSGLYCTTAGQISAAKRSKEGLQRRLGGQAVMTEVDMLRNWFRAEDFHQKYLENGGQCARKGDLSPIRCYG